MTRLPLAKVDDDAFAKQGDYRVLWCPYCLYAVSFTQADYETYEDNEWRDWLQQAAAHEHAAAGQHEHSCRCDDCQSDARSEQEGQQ